MHWRKQGDLGELSAMEWFTSKGAIVCSAGAIRAGAD
jgi:hypothetical protein